MKLYITFSDKGFAFPDSKVIEKALESYISIKDTDQSLEILVSAYSSILAYRVLVKRGIIKPEEIIFVVNDKEIQIDKNGKLSSYPKEYNIDFSLELPPNYGIKSFPESKAYALAKNDAQFKLIMKNNGGNKVILNSTIIIDKPVFNNLEYEALKTLFNHIINSQKTYLIIQKKIAAIDNKMESAIN